MGNFNPNYFERKAGSLERAVLDAVNGVQSQINENQYYEYKFKNKNDAMKAKSMLDGIQLMNFDINDDNISNGELMVDAGKKNMSKYHNMIMKQFKPKVMAQEKLVGGQKKLDKDKDGDIDGKDFAMLRKSKKESVNEADDFKPHMMYDPKTGKGYEAKTMEDHLRMKKMGYDHEKPKMENYDIGTPENTKAKLDATPGQSSDEWNQQVEMMQKKNMSMREALAKVWGFDEGKNPFEKNIDEKKEMGFKVEFGKGDDSGMAVYRDKKDAEAFAKRQPKPIKITKGMYDRFDEEDKTMTGKPATKVSVDPDMKEKKN
jgi:hypothetical protein